MTHGQMGWLKRSLIFVHRWLGVALCLVFLLWFLSGIGMMYWDFPSVTAADRLERSPALDPSTIRLSPAEAYARIGFGEPPAPVRLNSFDDRPAYRFRTGRSETIVYADTGEQQSAVSKPMMDRIAAAWVGQPASAARVESIEEVDQWTVQAPLRNLRPLWKYSWPNGEQLYISETSGEVVQYTTRASRLGAYVGAIPHWLYFTPLRKHQVQWSTLVIWSSGIGTFAAIFGIAIGVWMYSPAKRYQPAGSPTSIPYQGQKRWHMILGLVFGVATATWAFSGMLSMDPFPTRTGGAAGSSRTSRMIAEALRGQVDMTAFAVMPPQSALRAIADLDVKELELTSFAGAAIYIATLTGGDTRVVGTDGRPRAELDHDRIVELIAKAAGPDGVAETRLLDQYDAYYLDRRRGRPLPVILARMNDTWRTRYYIDPKTAGIVATYNSRDWVTRWVYHGLHSLNFPWLYNYRPAWDIVVIVFMLGGAALSVTALVLAWRVIGGKLKLRAERV